MDSNTHSPQPPDRDWLDDLVEVTDGLTTRDWTGSPDVVRAERVPVRGGWPTAWTASGSRNSPGSTPAAPPAPNPARRWARPRPGSATGCI